MRRRVLVAALVLGLAVLPAVAEDDGSQRALRADVERAVADHDLNAAVAALQEVIDAPEKSGVAYYVSATDLALDLLPHEIGNPQAAGLASRALEVGSPSNREAWANAQAVRRRLLDDADVETGAWFVDKLMAYYAADQVPARLRYDLAYLHLDAGLQERALAIFRDLIERHPGEAEARLKLAEILEDAGDVPGALAQYDAVIKAAGNAPPTGQVLLAHVTKIRVLHKTARRYDDAERALSDATDAVSRAPLGRVRQDYTQRIEYEKQALAGTREHWGKVVGLKARVHRLLWVTLSGFVVVLGGGVVLLRRRELL